MALNPFAVVRIILSAIGRLCSKLSFEAAIASGAVISTTVPFCITTAACSASFSLDSRRTTLKTSYIVTVGTTVVLSILLMTSPLTNGDHLLLL